MISELYQELLLDHARRPCNFGELSGPVEQLEMHNPLCGDKIKLYLRIADQRIAAVSFTGEGCMISQAAASIFTDLIKDTPLAAVKEIVRQYQFFITGRAPDFDQQALGELTILAGIRNFPARWRCALLVCECLQTLLQRSETGCAGSCPAAECPDDCPER